ncbi:MAG: HAD-IIA family hydrolase [Solirubrobacteraceae bacterium]
MRPPRSPDASPAGLASAKPPRFDAYIFDLDGTLYVDQRPINGAPEAVAQLRADGAQVAFVTNNPLHRASTYAQRLSRIGIPASPGEITTSVEALLDYLDARYPGARVLAISEDVVQESLADAGHQVTMNPSEAQVVVVAFDRTFDYVKLHAAYLAVREHGATIIATNPDPYCPTAGGGLPDCAAMLAALEACTGMRAEAIVGKPSPHMVRTVLRRVHVDPARTAVVGDRLMTDVEMGQTAGATGILVLSGATRREDLAAGPVTADYVIDSVADLVTDRRAVQSEPGGPQHR